MARIASVVSNGCDPDPRVLREARWLCEAGHDVTIHAFDRLENLPQEEILGGVKIQRHRVGKTAYGGTILTACGLRRFRNSIRKTLKKPQNKIDMLHCHDADTLPLSKHVKVPVLFDMHDLQHTWVRMPAPRSILRKVVSSSMETMMLRRARTVDAIITSSQGFSDWLEIRGLKSTTVENRPPYSSHLQFPNSRAIGYFGKIREIAPFKLLFDAMNTLPADKKIKIIFAGDGTSLSEVQALAEQYTELEIEFSGKFKHQDLPSLMSEINLMFAMYNPQRGNINQGALPSKMFEAASYGRPSIVNQGTPMGALCVSDNLGLAVDWNDVKGLAEAITELSNVEVYLKTDESRERQRFLGVIETLSI